MSRLSSAILFQYNHPVELERLWPPTFKNTAPKSIITRMGQARDLGAISAMVACNLGDELGSAAQGFLQNVAFPLQFEFLFDFPGGLTAQAVVVVLLLWWWLLLMMMK